MSSDDSQLIEAVKDGNHSAFRQLFEMYKRQVYTTAFRMLNNREDALDVLQETFVTAYQTMGAWQPRAVFSTWLYRVVVNKCIDMQRKRATQGKYMQPEYNENSCADVSNSNPEKVSLSKEIASAVGDAMRYLPEGQKVVFILRYYEGLTLKEIAEIRECAVGTVKTNLFRAVRTLRKKLKEYR